MHHTFTEHALKAEHFRKSTACHFHSNQRKCQYLCIFYHVQQCLISSKISSERRTMNNLRSSFHLIKVVIGKNNEAVSLEEASLSFPFVLLDNEFCKGRLIAEDTVRVQNARREARRMLQHFVGLWRHPIGKQKRIGWSAFFGFASNCAGLIVLLSGCATGFSALPTAFLARILEKRRKK